MLPFLLKFAKSNDELKSFFHSHVASKTIKGRREKISIAAIDDEPFEPQANLQTYGYRVIPKGDISKIDEVAEYDIVLCDLMGVGRYFDTKMEGASIIKEIKRTYPEKYVIAYTGAGMNMPVAKQAVALADEIIRKDVQIDEWVERLDSTMNMVQDPYYIWIRIRGSLIEKNIDTKDLMVLEDAYVRSVLEGDKTFGRLAGAASSTRFRDDFRAIIHGLVSSTAVAMMFGA